jgi:hypothetical protein
MKDEVECGIGSELGDVLYAYNYNVIAKGRLRAGILGPR